MLLASFMSTEQLNKFPPTIVPGSLHLDGYRYLFENAEIGTWFLNSVIVSLVCVVASVVFCSMAGYAFARMRFRGSKLVLGIMLATLIIPFQLTLIPTFIIMERLGLIDTLGRSSCRRSSRRSGSSCCGSSSSRSPELERPPTSTAARAGRSCGRSCCRSRGPRWPRSPS